jgi:hypothetical protein
MNNGMNVNAGGAMQPMGQPMGQPQMPKVIGVLVPVVIQTAMGEVTVMAQFGEAEAANVPALVSQLQQMGWPVKAYAPKPQFNGGGGYGGGGNFGNQGGGGYGGGGFNGGGYRRGGRY